MGVGHQCKQVADTKETHSSAKHPRILDQCAQHSVSPCAASFDDEALGIRQLLVGQRFGCSDGVFHVENSPLPFEGVKVCFAVTGRASVIHLHVGEAPAGEERGIGVVACHALHCGAAVNGDDRRRKAFSFKLAVRGWVEQPVHFGVIVGFPGERLGLGEVIRRDVFSAAATMNHNVLLAPTCDACGDLRRRSHSHHSGLVGVNGDLVDPFRVVPFVG